MKGFISTEEFLISKGIKLGPKNNISLNTLSKDEILEQLELINKVHGLINGGSNKPYLRLINTVGKEEEEFKILLCRFYKIIKTIKENGARNEFENKILILSKQIIKKAEYALKGIFSEGYEEIILRSMKNKEVILYYADNNSLYYNGGIKVYKDKGISYNFNEIDYARYISRLKKNSNKIDLNLTIDEYIDISKKSEFSKKYIKSYVDFPQEILKLCVKYYERQNGEKLPKYLDKLNASNFYEGLL